MSTKLSLKLRNQLINIKVIQMIFKCGTSSIVLVFLSFLYCQVANIEDVCIKSCKVNYMSDSDFITIDGFNYHQVILFSKCEVIDGYYNIRNDSPLELPRVHPLASARVPRVHE